MERSCGGVLETAPPRPGGSLKRNSCGLSPARLDKRSPRASRRISWACIWPSLTAMAFRFSRRKSSVLRLCCSCADRTIESSSDNFSSAAWRTVTQNIASARLHTSSAMNMAPATKCAVVKVNDFALASRLETTIICTWRLFSRPNRTVARIPGAIVLDRQLQAGQDYYFCHPQRGGSQAQAYASGAVRTTAEARGAGYRNRSAGATPGTVYRSY